MFAIELYYVYSTRQVLIILPRSCDFASCQILLYVTLFFVMLVCLCILFFCCFVINHLLHLNSALFFFTNIAHCLGHFVIVKLDSTQVFYNIEIFMMRPQSGHKTGPPYNISKLYLYIIYHRWRSLYSLLFPCMLQQSLYVTLFFVLLVCLCVLFFCCFVIIHVLHLNSDLFSCTLPWSLRHCKIRVHSSVLHYRNIYDAAPKRPQNWTTTQYENYIFIILFLIGGGPCIVSYFPVSWIL